VPPRRFVLGALALSDCGPTQGCLRGRPRLPHVGHPAPRGERRSQEHLARGQFITERFDESKAVDFSLQPGEMAMFDNSLVHGSGTNFGPDRRFLLWSRCYQPGPSRPACASRRC